MSYHTLLEKIDGKWHPQFGDHDKENAIAERSHMRDNGINASDLKIITTKTARFSEVMDQVKDLNLRTLYIFCLMLC